MKTTNLIASVIVLAISMSAAMAQTKTTEALQKKHDASSLFFYNNTLRMLNQKEDKDFDELIKNIEKMKLLIINKPATFTSGDYKKIASDYKAESFEEAMTSRYEGKNLDIFIKGNDKVKGVIVMVNDSKVLYVLDIVGSIAMDKIGSFYKTIESSSDITNLVNGFKRDHEDHGDRDGNEKKKDQ